MATTTLTRNLKLRISSDLTADSKYNLNKLDSLGSIYQIDTNDVAKIRSKSDIQILPNDSDIGGSGTGGTVSFGSIDQPLSNLSFYADAVSFSGGFGLEDQAVGGTQKLNIKYKSDLLNAVDTVADRNLNIDMEGADRQLVLGGNLSILNYNLAFTLQADTSWTLPADNGSDGQVLTTDGNGLLSWTASSAASIEGLNDTDINNPQDGEGLVYNSISGLWENGNPTALIGAETAYNWEPADGLTKTITHNLGSQQVLATVLDTTDNYKTIEISDVTRPNNNQIVLTATSAPSGGNWLVLLKEIITN